MRSLLPIPLPDPATPPAAGSGAASAASPEPSSGASAAFSPAPLAPPADLDGVPVTMHPGQDVHLALARPLGELRAELAACTGRPELVHAPLYVDDRRLDDHHVVGHPPLLAGAVLRTTPTPCPTPERALAAPVHLAVLTGRRAGDLLPLEVSGTVDALGVRLRVRRDRRGGVRVAVRADRRRMRRGRADHGQVERSHADRGRADRGQADRGQADRGQADGGPRRDGCRRRVSLTSPTGRVNEVGRGGCLSLWPPRARWPRSPWRRWRQGYLLTVEDGSVPGDLTPTVMVELREQPVLAERTYSAVLAALEPDDGGPPALAAGTRPMTGTLLAGLVPAIGSITLAIVLRNPLFAIMALTAPLMILGPLLARRRRGRGHLGGKETAAAHSPTGHGSRRAAGQDTTLQGSWDSPWGRDALRAGVPPADLLTAAAACAALPGPVPPPVVAGPPPPLAGRNPALPGDLSDGCLAIVGPRAQGAALAARMLVSLHAGGRGETVTVLCDVSRREAWAWARWLPQARIRAPSPDLSLEAGPGGLLVVDCLTLGPLVTRLGAWHATHAEQAALIVLVDDVASVPSWCAARAVIEVGGGTGGAGGAVSTDPWEARVVWSSPGTAEEVTTFDGVAPGWLDSYARRVAALSQRGRWNHLPRSAGAALTAAASGSNAADRTHGLHLPRRAALIEVPGIWEVERRWRENSHGPARARAAGGTARASETLEARIGVGHGGEAVTIDLLRDGPHALVAGTTGSGKSELLQTLVLTLALAHSPDDLTVALVDYKGGASFGECARLPHVVGQVTDLDPGAAERALTGLRAELRRRERLFAGVGAGDLGTYRARRSGEGALPRLLIVVDEFRAMADDHPDFIPGLVRIAAQGRSLGVHLVLATQRPSGAITGDMRANISLRIALRVAGVADSQDVIDAPDAAWIPADLPGRAVVRRGLGPPEELQTYFAGGLTTRSGPGVWHSPPLGAPDDACSPDEAGGAARAAGVAEGTAGVAVGSRVTRSLMRCADEVRAGDARPAAADPVAALVSHAVQVAARLGIGRPRVPWTPALPTRIRWEDLDTAGSPSSVLLLGLADHPQDQQQRSFGWAPGDGHLLVLGRAGSGRTCALRTVARAALAAGHTVHLLGSAALMTGFDAADPHLGTVAGRWDPRRVARLLTVLMSTDADEGAGASEGRGPIRHVVVVDGLEDLLQAMSSLHRGAGLDLFLSVLREGPSRGIAFALSGAAVPTSALAALIRHRLIFSGGDKHEDAFLGIPSVLAGLGGGPGRAVLVTGPTPLLCQVAVAESVGRAAGTGLAEPGLGGRGLGGSGLASPWMDAGVGGGAGTGSVWSAGSAGSARRTRIVEVPFRARTMEAAAPAPGLVLLGRGGDDAGPLWVRASQSFLVCGPHGSGRTAVLARLLSAPSDADGPSAGSGSGSGSGDSILGVISRDARLADRARALGDVPVALGDVPVLSRLTPAAAGRFVDDVHARLTARAGHRPRRPLRLVIDDLDTFSLSCPTALDALCALADGGADGAGGAGGEGGAEDAVVLVASATTVAAAGAFRGALADLRAARYGLVLTPGVPGSSEIFGSDLGWHVEPEMHRPGRGVLVDGSTSTFVQVIDESEPTGPR